MNKKINYYVFIDGNNGHFYEYYNFSSNASTAEIINATLLMKIEHPSYLRKGSTVNDLLEKLIALGFCCELNNNARDRRDIDRIGIDCIRGNY